MCVVLVTIATANVARSHVVHVTVTSVRSSIECVRQMTLHVQPSTVQSAGLNAPPVSHTIQLEDKGAF